MKSFYPLIIEQLRAHGFHQIAGGKGSHEKWRRGSTILTVPFSCKSRHTANGIMRDAGISKRF